MKRFATATILCCVHQIYGFVPETRLQSIGSTRTRHQMTKNDSVSVQKARQLLEEGYRKQIFGRKPLKLDYRTSRRWIQKNWAPKSKEEFYDLVANGNLRTPYISKQPEQYYGDRGEWISWDHYLLGTDEEDDENGIFEHRVTKWG
jgi:hypothetical protein